MVDVDDDARICIGTPGSPAGTLAVVVGVGLLCFLFGGAWGESIAGAKEKESRTRPPGASAQQETTEKLTSLIEASKLGKSLAWVDGWGEMKGDFSPAEIRLAKGYVLSHPDHTSYLLLFAIRRNSSRVYEQIPKATRAAILCSGMQKNACLNEWGCLGSESRYRNEAYGWYPESEKALLETGREGLKCLKPLLEDMRPALFFGSAEATDARACHYRRADFAYWYICLILGRKPFFDLDPKKRDKHIQQLAVELRHARHATLDVLVAESEAGSLLFQTDGLREKKWSDTELRAARKFVESHPDRAYLVLLEIRRQARRVYEQIPDSTKAFVLCSALKNSRFLNDWGRFIPGVSYDGEAAKALLATGKEAPKHLRPLLSDTRPTRLSGVDPIYFGHYEQRYADYAYRYVSLILGRKPVFHPDPKERDEEIRKLIEELGT